MWRERYGPTHLICCWETVTSRVVCELTTECIDGLDVVETNGTEAEPMRRKLDQRHPRILLGIIELDIVYSDSLLPCLGKLLNVADALDLALTTECKDMPLQLDESLVTTRQTKRSRSLRPDTIDVLLGSGQWVTEIVLVREASDHHTKASLGRNSSDVTTSGRHRRLFHHQERTIGGNLERENSRLGFIVLRISTGKDSLGALHEATQIRRVVVRRKIIEGGPIPRRERKDLRLMRVVLIATGSPKRIRTSTCPMSSSSRDRPPAIHKLSPTITAA